ncbi:hypothetical protein NQ318_003126 [Aromia moschata]|uniref:t-SNARE coiled-coil homology domain-containing protein n=1 Tax=Aromia moschata TaxID=1265417 RepID=A0AAV8YV28_9CUCU|nr:hypothetical protein NQ318_003126 [Aromia moschata]
MNLDWLFRFVNEFITRKWNNTMANILNPTGTKQSLKCIEIPLNKFTEEVVPHHQKIFEQYKATVQKLVLVNNGEQLKREVKDKKRLIKQLRDLMYELDTLRTQVEDADLDKFDTKTLSLRKIIISLITGYTGMYCSTCKLFNLIIAIYTDMQCILDLEKTVEKVSNSHRQDEETDKENCDPFEGTSQLQLEEDLESLKLKQRQEQLNKVDNLNKDVGELHEMYKHLNEMVDTQKENVEHSGRTVETAQQNVEIGTRDIIKAHRLRAVAYPVTGAFLGGIIGGPIGLVAGLKIGGVAALGCAIAGYTGGKYFKKWHEPESIQPEEKTKEETPSGATQKKDI